MKPKVTAKITVDIIMTIMLLAQMAHHLIGELPHEWIGVTMFVLFAEHHILNWSWVRNLRKGQCHALRILQVCINLLMSLSVIGLMIIMRQSLEVLVPDPRNIPFPQSHLVPLLFT